MKRVLFVDDDPKVLEGLKRMLHPLRKEWTMDFVSSGRQALERLAQSEYDVLVTDIRMPEMSGIGLLEEVIQRYPRLVRIVLSGTSDHDVTLQSVLLAHQYLMKPCDARVIRATVENAFALVNLLSDPPLRGIIGRLQKLPSAPSVYLRLMDALESDAVTSAQIGAIIAQDPGMGAKVLQLANSPLFGHRTSAGLEEAVVWLGVDVVRALALTQAVFSQFGPWICPGFSLEELRHHSFRVATLSREIARARHFPSKVVADIFLGGLLHDIGKLVLGRNFSDQYREVVERARDSDAIRAEERERFGTTHAEVGAYLLWLWGIPSSVTEIVRGHHSAAFDPERPTEPAAIVQIADATVRGDKSAPDDEELAALGAEPALAGLSGDLSRPSGDLDR